MRIRFLLLALSLSLAPCAAQAHEVWFDVEPYQAASGTEILGDLKNGEKFEGRSQPYISRTFVRFERIHDGKTTPVSARLGDRPAFRSDGLEDGLHILVYQSAPSWLRYHDWAKFARFASHKDFRDIEARHTARGLPRAGFIESYTRYSKALIGVGTARGQDVETGLETEIVALANPYAGGVRELPVRVLLRGTPRSDAQVELFERAPDGTVSITLHRTDADGVALLPVRSGHAYLADAVTLREPHPDADIDARAVWETLWASLTFSVAE